MSVQLTKKICSRKKKQLKNYIINLKSTHQKMYIKPVFPQLLSLRGGTHSIRAACTIHLNWFYLKIYCYPFLDVLNCACMYPLKFWNLVNVFCSVAGTLKGLN